MTDAAISGSNGSPNRRGKPLNPAKPLRLPARELLCQRIAAGVPLKEAYKEAGYTGSANERCKLRNQPEIRARVDWLLERRVDDLTRRRHRTEKSIDDIRLRMMQRLEEQALGDIRSIIQWDKKPVYDAEGNFTGFADEMQLTPSRNLTAGQASLIKGVFKKGDSLRVETISQQEVMRDLLKALGMFQDSAPPPVVNNTVNQVNISGDAVEAVRRVAFMLEAANKQAEKSEKAVQPLTIDATPTPAK